MKVMKAHWEDFVKFYEDIGEPRRCWQKVRLFKERNTARTYTDLNHVGEQPTHNKVCCLKMKQKQSKEEVEWILVRQKWLEEEVNIGGEKHGEKHKIHRPKKTWEICASHTGAYSYFMYLNPSYELAFEGVAYELGLDLGGDLVKTVGPEDSASSISLGSVTPIAEEDEPEEDELL